MKDLVDILEELQSGSSSESSGQSGDSQLECSVGTYRSWIFFSRIPHGPRDYSIGPTWSEINRLLDREDGNGP